MRSTIDVLSLIEHINLRNSKGIDSPEARQGWNSVLAHVLHETGNYAGWGYLTAEQVPEGQLPGIVKSTENEDARFPDETRRFYYASHKLTEKKVR